jgi:hypothetical protein
MTSYTTFDSALKNMRILYLALLLEIPIFVYAGEVTGPAKPKNVTKAGLLLVALAVLNAWSVLSSRRAVREASDTLWSHLDDVNAIRRWRVANTVSLCASLPLALYGWIFRVVGATLLQAAPFYVCGLLLLLISTPRRLRVSTHSV